MPIDDPHRLKPENRSRLWRARHLNIRWEDRTLLYLNRIIERWKVTEFHAKKEKDNRWCCWWRLEDKEGDIGKTTTKTFGMSFLGCIVFLYRNWPGRLAKERRERAIIEEFFEALKRNIGEHLNLLVPPVFSKDRYATFYRAPDDGGEEAKQIKRENRERRKEYRLKRLEEIERENNAGNDEK